MTEIDPCLYFGNDIVCLTYVDDVLFFARDATKMDELIKSLREEFKLTEEEDTNVFDFLGVYIRKHEDGSVKMTQTGLIAKILEATCLLYTSPSPRDGATSRMPSSA